jgi:hypothetical protein
MSGTDGAIDDAEDDPCRKASKDAPDRRFDYNIRVGNRLDETLKAVVGPPPWVRFFALERGRWLEIEAAPAMGTLLLALLCWHFKATTAKRTFSIL